MAKASAVEARLDRLAALRLAPSSPEAGEELRKALANKSNLVVAKAAALIAEFRRNDCAPELVAAFERFMEDSAATDKGCAALTAAAKALLDTDERADADGARRAFLAGVRHEQMEPAWGGPVDAAAELRGLCGMGLVKTGYKDAMVELTDLLADPAPPARAGAARALGFCGRDDAALLLRFKMSLGDREPDVAGECLASILRLSPRWAVEYVAGYLDDFVPAIRASAALALGESRQPAALEPLRERLRRETEAAVRAPLFLAVAMLRTPESLEVMVSVITSGKPADAAEAAEAMGIYRHDAAVRAQVEVAVTARNEAPVVRAFRAAFPT